MKKIYLYITCIALLTIGLASCEDNTDVTGLHELTQAQKDELARQDSILEAQKNHINADLVLRYTVKFLPDPNLYDGATLDVEMDKIAELFGLSTQDLLDGIAGKSGAPEIKGFAINTSTGAEVGTITNTNSPWGHWWDAKGDVTTWGTTDMIFAEFNTDEAIFNIGQRPARLVEGQEIRIIEGLQYNGKRAAVVISFEALGENINAIVVATQQLDIEIPLGVDYDKSYLQFDMMKTMADLGVSSMSEVQFVGLKDSEKYTAMSDENNGFSHDAKGFVSFENSDIVFYTVYGLEGMDANTVGLVQNPKNISVGDKITIRYGFSANEKIEMLTINIVITDYDDPEVSIVEEDIAFTKPWTDNYDSISKDITETLRKALNMTSFQIRRAIITEELKVYLNDDSSGTPEYTGEAPGYWISADGTPGSWGEGLVMCSIKHNDDGINIMGMNHPGNSKAGDTISTKMIVTCEGKKAIFNITFKITE